MPVPRTRLYRLLEERLEGTLADFVAARRPAGWRTIAAEITQLTGIEVTHEALRLWFSATTEGAA